MASQFGPAAPVTIEVPLGALSPGALLGPAGALTTIDQSELSSQLGLGLGGAAATPPGPAPGPAPAPPSPERGLSPAPSPAGSLQDEELEDFQRPQNFKFPFSFKKKDPNEPQKPVSAYALFFRDTQAAIKGQNPNATFGEVSKIVASMWDSLGEEQKQVYKRKTEAAKKEYLKALTAYKATLVPQNPGVGRGGQEWGRAPGAAPEPDAVFLPKVESPPQVELVAESPVAAESPRSRCVRAGCENPPVASGDWDEEFCSSECLVRHCRDVFLAWLAARNAGNSVVFVK
uniref:TOX high mobility group box family member 4 n=1 Tax=Corvus moneduloides TaxID=1196302 RepID=A0A8U7NME9_CORMO